MSASLAEHVADFARGLPPGPGVVAVSGGPDSVALLLALVHLPTELRPLRLLAAHLNHQLRGPDSDADALFVEQLARRLADEGRAVVFHGHTLPVAERARSEGANLEELARRLRYEWLTEVARAEKASWVATGHTADDQAETVLFRLLRGTGLDGLRGIPVRRLLAPGIELVRPLLAVRRQEVFAVLQKLNQPFREDQSNVERRFTRNRLRHELLPLLAREYNPEVVDLLCRLAEQAREVQEFLREQASALLAQAELPRAGGLLILGQEVLHHAPRVLVREMLRLAWKREGWPESDMTFVHWDRLAGLAHGEETALDLPGGVWARVAGRVVQLGRDA